MIRVAAFCAASYRNCHAHVGSPKIPLKKDGTFKDGADTAATTVRITGSGFPSDVTEYVSTAESVNSNGIVVSDAIDRS